jgi:hypothetical protein
MVFVSVQDLATSFVLEMFKSNFYRCNDIDQPLLDAQLIILKRLDIMSIQQKNKAVADSWAHFLDIVQGVTNNRYNEDTKRHEENTVELQGIVMAAGVLTEDISKAMDMVVENQISRARDLVKPRFVQDVNIAHALLKDVIDRLEPFLKPAPFKDPIDDRPAEITYFEVPDHRLVVEYPKNSDNFYILDCPICQKDFDTVRFLYEHIVVAHQGILTGQKSYTDALEIGGTLIKYADRKWMREHNQDYRFSKNVSFLASSCDEEFSPCCSVLSYYYKRS